MTALAGRPRAAREARLEGLPAASLGALGVLLASAVLGYLAQVGTARLVGPEAFGLYVYAFAWVTLLAQASTLGSHVSLLRFVPAYRAREEWGLLAGVVGVAARATALAGVAAAILGALAVAWGGPPWTDLDRALLLGLAAVPLLALQLVAAATARALGAAVAALIPERLLRDAAALGALALLTVWGLASPGAAAAMGAMLGSAALILAASAALARRLWPAPAARARPETRLAEWWRPTLPLTVIMLADVALSRTGTVALGLAGDTRGAGVFAVCVALSVLAGLPRMAVASLFAPRAAALHAGGDAAGLQGLLRQGATLSLGGAVAVGLPVALASPWLLGAFGPGFAEAWPVVAILVAGQVAAASAGPQQHLMTMTGRERAGAAMQAGAALLGVVLAALLAPRWGAVGAAWAAALALAAWNAAMALYAARALGLRPGLWPRHPEP